jgi:hypothetical protein
MRPSLLLLVTCASLGARSVRLLSIDGPADAPPHLHVVAGGEVSRIDLPRLAISSGKAEVPSGAVRIFLAERTPTNREPLPANAPFADLPAGEQDALLVLLPNGKPGPLGFSVQAIDFSPARLPEGGVLWMNLSRRVLEARLGSSSARVAPGQSRVMIPGVAPGAVYPVLVDLAPGPADTEPLPLLRASWVREAGRRQLLLVLEDSERAVPRVVAVPHWVSPPPGPGSDVPAR